MNRIYIYGVVFLVIGCCVTGCKEKGPDLKPVTGTVTADGKPLIGAAVEFHSEVSSSSYGKTDENGNFTLSYATGKPGAALGKHRVAILGGSTDPSKVPSAPPADTTPTDPDREAPPVVDSPPSKTDNYNLSAEVTAAGPNHFEFKL